MSVLADTTYAGWGATSDKEGVLGYISQDDADNYVSINASWIGLCSTGCAALVPVNGYTKHAEWVQQGVIQGSNWAGTGASPTHVRFYYENWNPCNEYFALADAAAPSSPYFFQIKYAGTSLTLHHCGNGFPYYAYNFNYRRGSSTVPFFGGALQTTDGRADANTEVHENQPFGNAWFGCKAAYTCDNDNYGIEVNGGSGWNLCCSTPRAIGPVDVAHEPGSQNPYRFTYNLAWSFKNCSVAASCT